MVYPNPSNGVFQVDLNNDGLNDGSLEVIGPQGELVKQIEAGELRRGSYRVDMQGQSSGVYFIKLKTQEAVQMKKVVILD